eukprot:scaffold104956_cov28-Tisochrysis_lutea.AAC.5
MAAQKRAPDTRQPEPSPLKASVSPTRAPSRARRLATDSLASSNKGSGCIGARSVSSSAPEHSLGRSYPYQASVPPPQRLAARCRCRWYEPICVRLEGEDHADHTRRQSTSLSLDTTNAMHVCTDTVLCVHIIQLRN